VTWALCLAAARAEDVAVVLSSGASPYRQAAVELEARLRKLGHAPRTALLADLRNRGGLADRADAAYVGVGTSAAAWLCRNAPAGARMAYCMVSDPNQAGLLKRPNTGGVCLHVPLTAQFRLIAEALPRAQVVGMLYRAKTHEGPKLVNKITAALPKGWRLEAVVVEKHHSMAKAIEAILSRKVDVIWTCPDSSVYDVATVRSLLLTGIRRNVPVFGFSRAFVRAGALLGVGIDPRTQGRQAAEAMHRLLVQATTKPSAEAANSPARRRHHADPEYIIAANLIVAKKLSIELPAGLTGRADCIFRQKGASRE